LATAPNPLFFALLPFAFYAFHFGGRRPPAIFFDKIARRRFIFACSDKPAYADFQALFKKRKHSRPTWNSMLIPYQQLSAEALQGLIEEFVTREGTDYGEIEVGLAEKVAQVRRQLESGQAVIVFDPRSGTVSIRPSDGNVML
jgi:uncharacterized protein YheU (UPF0270 family)